MWTAIFCLLLAGAGLGKAVADATAHGSPRLTRWFPSGVGPDAWRGKYRNNDPAQGPRFFLSTTALVFATDVWHFANFVTWACADAAFLLAAWTPYKWGAVAAVIVRRCIFQPVYGWLRK